MENRSPSQDLLARAFYCPQNSTNVCEYTLGRTQVAGSEAASRDARLPELPLPGAVLLRRMRRLAPRAGRPAAGRYRAVQRLRRRLRGRRGRLAFPVCAWFL